ncbi:hypothetical protein [Enterococcus sp. AZ192]|uniref:hypothetical protein n=1 Tax=Enterococcus sp. AZ192 TaxID=2774648 RepID=UPI003D2D19CD
MLFITTTGYARVDDEQYLATKGSEVSILGITQRLNPTRKRGSNFKKSQQRGMMNSTWGPKRAK